MKRIEPSFVSQIKKIETKKDMGTTYECGQCYSKVKLVGKENIMCRECGYRVLYKCRLDKRVEYSAV